VAVQRIIYQDTLRMRYNLGPDPKDPGRDLIRVRSFTRARPATSDQNLFDLAQGFEKLFDADLINTYRVMHVELTES